MLLPTALRQSLKPACALAIVLPLLAAGDAQAQQTRRHADLPAQSWQKGLDQVYPSNNQQSDLDRARGVLYRDHGRAIGLPSNNVNRPAGPSAPAVAPATLAPSLSRLDTDRDGSISRTEYMQGRSRLPGIGIRANRFGQRQTQRLSSQFRRADLNGDGKVTAQELETRGGGRF